MTSAIAAIVPHLEAQGIAHVIHVPNDHSLQARAMAEAIGCAIEQSTHVDIKTITTRAVEA